MYPKNAIGLGVQGVSVPMVIRTQCFLHVVIGKSLGTLSGSGEEVRAEPRPHLGVS